MSISKVLIPNFVCVLINKRYNIIERNFHSVARVIPQGGTWGAGVKVFSVGICHGALVYFLCLSCFCVCSVLPCGHLKGKP